ncbi:MAG TPA: UDP-N-acetylglucosamine 2-epimerase (non-hydrolyzing) [Gaiellaceae bacterium]|nr:UDP-N-acetylglucosamine 2-epimerase (non-hydrolyzing) [Gaiellaceae bacterium]
MRVATILGTRPEVIKLAPVVGELRRHPGTECVLVATGQHREMVDQMLQQFGLEADVDLGVMQPEQRLSDLTAELMRGLGRTLAAARPDWVLIQGDTSTTLCGALAAFYESVPVAHVEAGLRSGNDRAPFPEEANRRLVTCITDLHFCPTPGSAANLVAESVPPDRIIVTGNTVIDALLWAVDRARALPAPVPRVRPRRILLTLHRRESHGDAMRNVCEVVRAITGRGDTEVVFPVHRNPAVREVVLPLLAGVEGVHLCEPLDYLDLVHVLDSCDLVLTDSGGLQEEAPALGKPVLVLRDTTERPEAVAAGVARVVGTTPHLVHAAVSTLLDDQRAYRAMAHPENPFGDGRASARVVSALAEGHAARRAA